jgi:hypothetical protein
MASRGAVSRDVGWARRGSGAPATWAPPDARRRLQLGLAAIWLLDGVLQYQSVMFTRAFGQLLAESGTGNPAFIADSVSWAARIIEHNPATTNAAFATIQLALGLGIAWRRTIKIALAASIGWSVAVWWFGEGLGGVLTGDASPVNGAPGAVILYALLAVLLWPGGFSSQAAGSDVAARFVAARFAAARFVAAQPLGARTARGVWLVLWGSLAYFAVLAGNRTAQGLHDMIAGMADGEPSWMASVNQSAASVLAHHGLAASVVLAVLLGTIALGVFLPAPAVRVTVVLAVVVSVVIWVVGQDLGELLAGGATDVNSGPLLVLIALAYWPLRGVRASPATALGTAVPARPASAVPASAVQGSAVPHGAGSASRVAAGEGAQA